VVFAASSGLGLTGETRDVHLRVTDLGDGAGENPDRDTSCRHAGQSASVAGAARVGPAESETTRWLVASNDFAHGQVAAIDFHELPAGLDGSAGTGIASFVEHAFGKGDPLRCSAGDARSAHAP